MSDITEPLEFPTNIPRRSPAQFCPEPPPPEKPKRGGLIALIILSIILVIIIIILLILYFTKKTTTTSTTNTPALLGGSCISNSCSTGLNCENGVCKNAVGKGPCNSTSTDCSGGSLCNSSDNICKSPYGGFCSINSDCIDDNLICTNGSCSFPLGCSIDSDCNTTNGPQAYCGAGNICTVATMNGVGENCNNTDLACFPPYSCLAGTCV